MQPAPAAIAAALLLALGGCYESLEPEPQAASAPPASAPPPVPGIDNTPRPGLSGAKRAAHNTADRVEQHQRKLEEMLEDDG